jgi:DNA-binding sugar fermentation-stimulating protein
MRQRIMRLPVSFIGRRRDETVEEKRSTVIEVVQCFHFEEKREMSSTHFKRGMKHARRLLVLVRRGVRRMQRCGDMQQRSAAKVGLRLD